MDLVGFIIRFYNFARSPERLIHVNLRTQTQGGLYLQFKTAKSVFVLYLLSYLNSRLGFISEISHCCYLFIHSFVSIQP